MGCNCKKKRKPITNLVETTPTFEWNEVGEAMKIINTKIHYTYEEQQYLYDLHNRIYPLKKQYNFNCGDCFRLVIKNITNYYERQKENN
jgi:hypothetical protein